MAMMSMFTRKRKAPAAPQVAFVLPVLQPEGRAQLEAKLRSEIRYCATCAYEIRNPMTDRCPRCFAQVPLSEHTNCGECSHQGNCTYQH